MKKVIFLFLSILTVKYVLNSAVCETQAKCDPDKNSNSCRYATSSEGVKTIFAKRCPDGKVCSGTWLSDQGVCQQRGLKFPGESCVEDSECYSKNCLITCQGNKLGEYCSSQVECDPGFYCYGTRCVSQKSAGERCTNMVECENGSGCWEDGYCRKFLSFDLGVNIKQIENRHYCKTNFAVVYSPGVVLCATSRMISEYLECPDDVSQCNYLAQIGTGQDFPYTLDCQCSLTETKRFCPLASENKTYEEGTEALREHFKYDATSLHNSQRMFLKSHTKNKKYQLANSFPALYRAPECLYEALLSVSFVKISFIGLLILGLVL